MEPREPEWFEHRVFNRPDERLLLLRDRLRADAGERKLLGSGFSA